MKNLFNGIYKNRVVLVTGHTGFKGSWLSLWLQELGAQVIGYALEPPTHPNHFGLLNLQMHSYISDIRDRQKLFKVIKETKPEIVFHLAAQPIVRKAYKEPLETLETNIIGTANVFEACKNSKSVRAILNITSDKCYENNEWVWGYRESDPMGGFDPYSASKGCSELITSAYRNSFFNLYDYEKTHRVLLASCRAGNVIGGGDWAEDRLIPDIMKATSKNEKVEIRSPYSTRPWQHVLEPLNGYLILGQKLFEGNKEFAEAWNFGPRDSEILNVKSVVEICKEHWNAVNYKLLNLDDKLHEANLLKLDCSKANIFLNWFPKCGTKKSIIDTIYWYKNYYVNNKIISKEQLYNFVSN
ncbi:CDP-glucose 4,6-dehydratase [bacterium]|nr:MAG: CDP-glucose 4,6-dehydratase [bacterium]